MSQFQRPSSPLSFFSTSPTSPSESPFSSLNFESIQHDVSLQTLRQNEEQNSKEYIERQEFLKIYDEEMREINARFASSASSSPRKSPSSTQKYSTLKSIFKAILFQESAVLMFYLAESIVSSRRILNLDASEQLQWSNLERVTTESDSEAPNDGDLLVVLQKSVKFEILDFVRKNFTGDEEDIEHEVGHLTENLKLETNADLLLVLLRWYKNVIERLLSEGDVVRNASVANTESIENHRKRMRMIATAQYRCGCIEWRMEQYEKAYNHFLKSSKLIMEGALNCFAFKFHGIGSIEQDADEAVRLLRRAIVDFPSSGRPYYYLALCCELGRGFPSTDYLKALELYEESATRNYRPALMHLYKWYLLNDPRRISERSEWESQEMLTLLKESKSEQGFHDSARDQIPYSPKNSFRHLQRCADYFHDADAQYELGINYLNGLYLNRDYRKALHWFTLSAEQGNHLSMHQLAILYSTGADDGSVKVSMEKAHEWAEKGAAHGNLWCQEFLGELREDYADTACGQEFTVDGLDGLEGALRHDAQIVYFFLQYSVDMKQLVRQPPLCAEHNDAISAQLERYCNHVQHFTWCISYFEEGAFRDSLLLQKSPLRECSLWLFCCKKTSTFGESHLTEFVSLIHTMRCKSFALRLHQRPENGTDWILRCIETFFKSNYNKHLQRISIEVRSASKSEATFETLSSLALNQLVLGNERE